MRLRPTLLALAVSLAAAGTSAAAQTAAPAAPRPATATQPAVRPTPAATARAASSARPATPAPPAAARAAKAEPIDINTATSADLKTIPGIGDVYAGKIIAGRPYHAKDDLARKKVLPASVYAKVKDRIIARQH